MIGYDTGVSPEGVDLAHDLPFGYTAHSGVATHLGDGVHVHGGEQHFAAEVGSGYGGLTAGMAAPDYYHVVLWEHGSWVLLRMVDDQRTRLY